MNVVIDIEANALINPTQIWVICCKDISTGEYFIFRKVTEDDKEKLRFKEFATQVTKWVGHNYLGYDYPVLNRLCELSHGTEQCYDTLILSKLIDYPRVGGHSIESYGKEFGVEKGSYSDWSKYSQEMEDYCVRDVDICHRIYLKYSRVINDPLWAPSIATEHSFQLVCNALHDNGFSFNLVAASKLAGQVEKELQKLDQEILKEFPPKLKLIREIHPKETKHGTLSRTDFRWVPDGDLSIYNGGPFCRCKWEPFNPSSHKQIVEVLDSAGWKPTDKTQTHIDTERYINRSKYHSKSSKPVDLAEHYDKLKILGKYGWKINETNLATLPKEAPSAAHSLAQRILYESRRRTLTEWLGLVQDDGRIHGKFYGLGAWTHRMAHQQPNTANIPNEFDTEGQVKLLGKELRSLWRAPRNRLLAGVDAEGIQLRIFAHYINDKEFTDSLVKGKKSDGSDPHSLNQRILGDVCKTRAAAKRFVYALLLGAGIRKLAEVLATSEDEARRALDRLMERYEGFAHLKATIIPNDAKHGWFRGLDGRKVRIPGETTGERKHLCMSGYLQNGEAVIMKMATLHWLAQLKQEGIGCKLVNFVHDEWQTETANNMEEAVRVAACQCKALEHVGKELKLNCPLSGSYYNDEHHDYTIGTNWYQTH